MYRINTYCFNLAFTVLLRYTCSISFTTLLLLLWQPFLKCPILLHPTHILPYARHCLNWWFPPQYIHGCNCMVWLTGALMMSSFVFLDTFTFLNYLDSVKVFSTAAWALCASILLAHTSMPPLVIWSPSILL